MSNIFDELQRLEEMQAKLDEQFDSAAHPSEEAVQIADRMTAVTYAINKIKQTDEYKNAVSKTQRDSGCTLG